MTGALRRAAWLSIWGWKARRGRRSRCGCKDTATTGDAHAILYQLGIGVVSVAEPDERLTGQSFSRSGLEVIEQVNLLAVLGVARLRR